MLRDTDGSIVSVAAALGYASQTAFAAAFNSNGKFAHRLALANTFAIVANHTRLVFQIETQHFPGRAGQVYRLGLHGGHGAEIVDLTQNCQSMLELLGSMLFKLIGDALYSAPLITCE
jgi:hypothetical protein